MARGQINMFALDQYLKNKKETKEQTKNTDGKDTCMCIRICAQGQSSI